MTCGRTNVLLNVQFQPLKSILLMITNYCVSTDSRNLKSRSDWKIINWKSLFWMAKGIGSSTYLRRDVFRRKRCSSYWSELHGSSLTFLLSDLIFFKRHAFIGRNEVSFSLSNKTQRYNWQNTPFLHYYSGKVIEIRIDEIIDKILLE